jgi:protein involved in sex pheromone biosynthesis
MKKICIAAIAALLIVTSCGKKSDGTHTHDDGEVHANHTDTTKQEVNVPADSTTHENPQDTTAHGHSHDH